MNYIFLDTNVFIHFKDFDQIDWKNLISSDEDFLITIVPTVIDELDSHKYNKNPKISKRIKRILPKIENYITTDQLVKLITSRPKNETFINNQLNKNEQDDSIFASIIEFKSILSEKDNIIYITYDTGPRLKAKTLSINCLKINESYLLPNEPDENEKRSKELEKELNKFKNQSPKVIIGFLENDNFYKCESKKDLKSKEIFISESVSELKEKFNYLEKIDFENSTNNLLKILSFQALSDDQIKRYNSELDLFFAKYEDYYSSIFDMVSYENECIEIKLIIRNDGTAPGEDIDIEFHFPDGFELLTKKGFPKTSKEPQAPYKPKNKFDYQHNNINFPVLSNNYKTPISNINLNAPTIKKTNSYNVDFHLRNLKHNQSFEFETLYLKYDNRELAKNFCIDYKIMISNYPEVITGKLNVIV